MSPDDVSDGEMPTNPFTSGRRRAASFQGDELAGWGVGADARAESDHHADPALTELLMAASADPAAHELLGEGEALTAFRAAMASGVSPIPARGSWRPRVITSLTATTAGKVALAALIGGASLGGASAAAFTNSLPSGLQNFAHHAIGAPKAHKVHVNGHRGHDVLADPSASPTVDPSATPTVDPSASPGDDEQGHEGIGTGSGQGLDDPSESPRPCPTPDASSMPTPAATPTATPAEENDNDNNRGKHCGEDHGQGEDHQHPTATPNPSSSAQPGDDDHDHGQPPANHGGGNGSGGGSGSGKGDDHKPSNGGSSGGGHDHSEPTTSDDSTDGASAS